MYLVPLQCPFCGSRFCKSMMGLPIFIMMMCVGNPDGVSLFMNSIGYSLSLFTVSQLLYFLAFPGIHHHTVYSFNCFVGWCNYGLLRLAEGTGV